MKKTKWVGLISGVLIVGIAVGAVGAGLISEIKAEVRRDFEILVDGEVKTFKNASGDRVYPILYEGTTYLPVRAIGELMDKKVYWFENEKKIELKDEKSTVTDADAIVLQPPAEKFEEKQSAKNYIGEERAKAIALEKAGLKASDASYIRAELDLDDGIWKYEVDIKSGIYEYDVDINAESGKIIKFEKDID